MANRDAEFPLPERTPENPFGGIVEDRMGGQMKITTYVDYFHTMYKAQYFQPFDPYLDCFMLFHPGLGHPASSHEWEETLPQLLETKVPIITTGYTQWDMERDINWVREKCAGEFDILLEPGENIFRSLRWDLNDLDPHDVSCGNWGLWAFRGKRYVIHAWVQSGDPLQQGDFIQRLQVLSLTQTIDTRPLSTSSLASRFLATIVQTCKLCIPSLFCYPLLHVIRSQ